MKHTRFLGVLLLATAACAPAPPPTPVSAQSPAAAAAPSDSLRGTVVLLHGLGRTHRSMRPMEEALEEAGYTVTNLGYESREAPVPELVERLAAELDACCASSPRPLNFVTHSLGGILVRAYLATHPLERLGRVVMLSPPNSGSEIVDRLPDPLLRLLLGPAAVQLGTDSASVLHTLPPPDFEVGVITGDASLNPLFSYWIPGPDDGKVSVASARVDGAADMVVVAHSHAFIMRSEDVIRQVLTFLQTGRFEGEPLPAGGVHR